MKRFVFALILLIIFVPPFFGAHAGDDGKRDARDAKGEKTIHTVGAVAQMLAGTMHGIAGGVCIACFAGDAKLQPACNGWSLAAGLTDIAQTVAVIGTTIAVGQKIDAASLGMSGMGALMGVLMAAKSASGSSSATDKEKESECGWSALFNAVLALTQFAQGGFQIQQMQAAGKKEKEMESNNTKLGAVAGASSPSSGGKKDSKGAASTPGVQESGSDFGRSVAGTQASSISGFAASASPAQKEAFNEFQRITNRPVSDVFDKIAQGLTPVVATGEVMAEGMGNPAIAAAARKLNAEAEKLLENPDVKKAALAAIAEENNGPTFASSESGGSHSAASESDPMAGILDAIQGMMPGQKKEEKKDLGVSKVKFGGAGPAHIGAATSDGFHAKTLSIFQIINSRYSQVSKTRMNEGF